MGKLLLAGTCVAVAAMCAFTSAQTLPKPTPTQTPTQVPAPRPITNADVINMVNAGLGEDVIIASIKSNPLREFDLSPDGLITLKTVGVPDNVLLVMQGRDVTKPPAAPPPPPVVTAVKPAVEDPSAPHEEGIYVMADGTLEQLDQAIATGEGAGAGSMIMSGLTLGLKKVKYKADIRNPKARLRVDSNAEFYFFGSAFNPNKFAIARLDTKGKTRQFDVGEAGVLGGHQGVREDDQLAFRAERIRPGTYKVLLFHALRPGEYAFVNLSDSKTLVLYDFGVDR